MRLIALILLCSIALTIDNPAYDRIFRKGTLKSLKQEQLWFDQITDHYNYDATKTTHWKQRYWVYD